MTKINISRKHRCRHIGSATSRWFTGSGALYHPTTNAFSIQVWFRSDDFASTNEQGLFKVTTNSGAIGDFMLAVDGSGTGSRFYLWENTGNDANGRHNYLHEVRLSVWNHIVVTVAAGPGTITYYYNGRVTAESSQAATFSGWNTETAVGTSWSSDQGYRHNGGIGLIGIWSSTVLTAANVTSLYNNGEALAYGEMDSTLTTGLTSFYPGAEEADAKDLIDSHGSNDLTAQGALKPEARITGPVGLAL